MHKLKSNHINLNEKTRLYQCPVPIIGLTGSIATGKSTVTKVLKELGIQIIDADLLVKEIYQGEKALELIREIAPSAIKLNCTSINFQVLRELFFNNPNIKTQIESFIYGELPRQFLSALESCDFQKADFIIYDVPLLFEKELIPLVDDFVLVFTDEKLQLKRLLARDNIDLKQAQKIIDTQISITKKRDLSKNIINNTGDISQLNNNTQKMLKNLTL